MSLKLRRAYSSSNLLNSLETMKSEEFGDQQITLEQVPQLGEICEHSQAADVAVAPDAGTKDLETPKAVKRKHIENSATIEPTTPVKKQKVDDTNDCDSEIGINLIPSVKNKKARHSDVKAKYNDKMKYIQHFVNISMKYSQFLEKKISNLECGTDNNSSTNTVPSPIKERPDITQQLKYFEGGTLRPYQVEGVIWLTILFENCVNGILADEMGLGKTIQIIALFSHLYERKVDGPFLIVAPLSTLGNWELEFKKFAPKIPVVRLQGVEAERREQIREIEKIIVLDGRRVKPVVICSYQVPQLEVHFLRKFCWTYIVVDEGHRIKNPDSKLSQELRALRSENRTLLTGTPLQNNIKELWALFNFLMPELFKDIEGFSSLIELQDMKDKDKILENEAQTKIISTIHKVLAPFMLRREKKYVLKDIVPKKEIIIYCPLTELQKYIYRAILKRDISKLMMEKPEKMKTRGGRGVKRKCNMKEISCINFSDQDDHFTNIQTILAKAKNVIYPQKENVPVDCPDCKYFCRLTMENITMMLKKIVNHPYLIWFPLDPKSKQRQLYISEDLVKHSGKFLVLDALLPKLKAGGHKVLIFSTLVVFMDLIEEYLIIRNYQYRRLDGGIDYDSRNESINDFMTNSEIFIFLLSTRAGGLGLNLTAADTVIFMDRDWNPMVDLQAQDRCHRIGQTKPVMVYSLIVKNTIDEVIVSCGDMKKRLEKIVLQEGKFKTLKKSLEDNDLEKLEELLNAEKESTKIRANGLIYTDDELNQILDRSELIKDMKNDN